MKIEGLPESVRIGPHDIQITLNDSLGDNLGLFHLDNERSELSLLREYKAPSVAVDTLIHECLHGIWLNSGLGRPSMEESVVRAMATGLTQIFRDNKELLAWISRTL